MVTCATSNFSPSWKVQITGESGSTVLSTVGFWDNSRGPRNLGPLTSFLQAQRCSSLHPISNPGVAVATVGVPTEFCCSLFSSAGSEGEASEVNLCKAPGVEYWTGVVPGYPCMIYVIGFQLWYPMFGFFSAFGDIQEQISWDEILQCFNNSKDLRT